MSETLRIGLLTPPASAQEAGGVEVFNDQLRRALGGVEVITDPAPDGHRFGDLRRVGLEQPYRALRAARRLLKRHREDPFHLVISNGVSGWPPALSRMRVPAVQVYHLTVAGFARDALSLPADRLTTGRVTALFDRLAGVGKHIVGVSPRVLQELERFYGLRGRLIPHGVDTSAFAGMDSLVARESLGLPAERPIGIFVGRPNRTKGYDIVRGVARRMPDVLFLVAGGTGAEEGNVRPIGKIPHAEMPRWYSASDFLLCPSRYEGFNLVLVEALACDIPAVVSEAAYALPENPTGFGIVVPGTDEGDFVAAIRRVLAERDTFSPREFVLTRYSFERFRDAWRALVASLVGAPDRATT